MYTHSSILGSPFITWATRKLRQHEIHLFHTNDSRLTFKLPTHGPQQLLTPLSPRFLITIFHITHDKLLWVILEPFFVHLTDHEVRNDNFGNDLLERRLIVENLLVHRFAHERGEEFDAGCSEYVMFGIRAASHEKIPDGSGEFSKEGNEGFLVFVPVEKEIVHDGGLEGIDKTGLVLFVVIFQERIFVLQVLCKLLHPFSHVILKVFRQILPVETVKDATHVPEGFKSWFELMGIIAVSFHALSGGFEERKERRLEPFQCVEYIRIELVGFIDISEPFEDGIGRGENTAHDGHIGRGEFLDEFGEEIVPLLGIIDGGNDANALRALGLDLGRGGAHEFDEVLLDEYAIVGGDDDAVCAVFVGCVPALFENVFEVDGSGLADMRV